MSVEFDQVKDRFSRKSISFTIDHSSDELEIESEDYATNGMSVERHTFRLSMKEARKLSNYLSEWIKGGCDNNG